ncbi:MAG TPA: RAMP superfamily CRISPR-associated protein [Roseiflexaceae bacterium]|nr:RAMP superfamily CRISPR-associated protein [Roseiflexaceae bacterium]
MSEPAETQTFDRARPITQRVVVRGTLELTAPAHFGGGVESDLADLALLRDAAGDGLLLPGTSIAGALRSELRAYERGHRVPEQQARRIGQAPRLAQAGLAELLLGGQQGDPDGEQSPLLIGDSLAEPTPIEVRDGVAIDPATRTAQDEKKYSLELVPAGTRFPLTMELLVPADTVLAGRLRLALALALDALQRGAIPLGARSARGYGTCLVREWEVTTYDLSDTDHLLAYLTADYRQQEPWAGYAATVPLRGAQIAELLGVASAASDGQPRITGAPEDQRRTVTLTARFALASPLLIRSDLPEREGAFAPDATHLRRRAAHVPDAPDADPFEPVLPGTSVAGALRARALRIANTLGARDTSAVEALFGPEQGGGAEVRPLHASRLRVSEQPLTAARSLVQSRMSIDRFTGGALDTALFSEAPLTAGEVGLTVAIHDPCDAEIGLLLLLLKDLWTGDLPLGGTSSIGRGRLDGRAAELAFSPPALPEVLRPAAGTLPPARWPIGAEGRLTVAPDLAAYLQACVKAIPAWLNAEATHE